MAQQVKQQEQQVGNLDHVLQHKTQEEDAYDTNKRLSSENQNPDITLTQDTGCHNPVTIMLQTLEKNIYTNDRTVTVKKWQDYKEVSTFERELSIRNITFATVHIKFIYLAATTLHKIPDNLNSKINKPKHFVLESFTVYFVPSMYHFKRFEDIACEYLFPPDGKK